VDRTTIGTTGVGGRRDVGCLTLAFEFLAGHYLFHNPWSRLLEDYDVARGRIWILVLFTTLLAPRVCASLRTLLSVD